MLKLVHGELYRLSRKKSMYIYFSMLIVGYCLFAFIRSSGFGDDSVVMDAANLFSFFPALAGGFLFAAIYTDDLNAKNLITLVGYGLSKTKIVLAKFVLGALFAVIFYGLLPLIHCGAYTLFGHGPTATQMAMVYAISVKYLLLTVAFFTLSSIVVYGLQRTTFAMVTYILFGFTVVTTILKAVINLLKLDIADHLVSGVTDRIFASIVLGDFSALPIIEYVAYIVIAVALSAVAFKKKEMEF